MAESLILFESVINLRWFLLTPIILFLNKIDVFKLKLPKVCSVHCITPRSSFHHSALLPIIAAVICQPHPRPLPAGAGKTPSHHPCGFSVAQGKYGLPHYPSLRCLSPVFLSLVMLMLLPFRSRWNSIFQNTRVAPISTRRPSTSCGSSCRQIGRG